jgi:hypothetical protein
MYRCTFFFTSVIVGDEWSDSRHGRFTPGAKVLISIGEEAQWAPEPVSTEWKENVLLYR